VDLVKVSQPVDLLNLMAYDVVVPGFQHCTGSSHHAQLRAPEETKLSDAVAVQCILNRGIPARKLLFGIPLYGHSFLGAMGVHQSYTASGVDFQYCNIPRPGVTGIYDRVLGRRIVWARRTGSFHTTTRIVKLRKQISPYSWGLRACSISILGRTSAGKA